MPKRKFYRALQLLAQLKNWLDKSSLGFLDELRLNKDLTASVYGDHTLKTQESIDRKQKITNTKKAIFKDCTRFTVKLKKNPESLEEMAGFLSVSGKICHGKPDPIIV